jgi:hypothetical protein
VTLSAKCTSQHVEVVPCDGVRNVHKSQHTKAVPCDNVCKVLGLRNAKQTNSSVIGGHFQNQWHLAAGHNYYSTHSE